MSSASDVPWWAALLAFLSDHTGPFVAGFLGALVGSALAVRYRARGRKND